MQRFLRPARIAGLVLLAVTSVLGGCWPWPSSTGTSNACSEKADGSGSATPSAVRASGAGPNACGPRDTTDSGKKS